MPRFYLSDRFGLNTDQTVGLLDDVDIHFQPICDVAGGAQVRGFEALGRKSDGPDGFRSIAPFLKDIYQAGLRPELEMVTLDKARVFLEMCDANLDPAVAKNLYVTVNLSHQTLAQRDLLKEVDLSIGLYPQAYERVRFEILEHMFPKHEQAIIVENIRALHGEGYRLYLDDFGDHPGQDEDRLRALHDLVHGVKLSGSLWTRGAEDRHGFLSSVAQAGGAGKIIVVEGVEEDEHLAETRAMAAKYGFGNLLAQGWHPVLGASMSPQTAVEVLSATAPRGPGQRLD